MTSEPHYHPSVNASIAAREKRERLSAARERAEEPDLQAAVRELAELLAVVLNTEITWLPLYHRAKAIEERLR